jgi:pilus assembly protein Flp/PilA
VIHFARKLAADESGVTAIEYGVLAAVLAIILAASVPAVASHLDNTFRTVACPLHGDSPTMDNHPGQTRGLASSSCSRQK